MKNKSLILAILFVLISVAFVISIQAHAKPKSKAQQKRLKQDMSFGDHSVGGQFQIPYGSMTVVEDEKGLDDLIGVRKNFKDRVEQAQGMR